ncbi:MAG: M23 family metallopeptidase [Verrucomicrobia bacterium]|nr:M23 family metallopeptidase [Verrucomicrobiota bacterium]
MVACFAPLVTHAQPFSLPTANRAIFKAGGEDEYFVPTPGKDWRSGTFGCVRSEGMQLHEGLDIRAVQRDKQGEPMDAVLATADGSVAYVNRKPGLSNYGNYVVLRHPMEGIEVLSLYAHLKSVRGDLKPGSGVKSGDAIGVMGRTTNTKTPITRERAHLHFEINLLASERFAEWHDHALPGQQNDHGRFNGQNLLGLDPRAILLAQRAEGPSFSLVRFLRNQTELCRVIMLKRDLAWAQRFYPLVRRNAAAEAEGIAGYELRLNFNGVPFQLTPRAPSELTRKEKFQLLSVNEAEQRANPARTLVAKQGGRWELTANGTRLLELLAY